ncbi:SusC/RagA family TonB-linked outer membrane protein [Hymenobacter jejuensis]|uniref:TonB-dependent receptor n=1 Tax=Hymenobacter jejuensis TaxID=2502781 RepID=A0A5B7ZUX3_9BACT|nr:TonB-dependent receptor [Hymenobacter jejuensis]QDA58589.1 TonB-dependent receptor [Hymenobacter jejuensis]
MRKSLLMVLLSLWMGTQAMAQQTHPITGRVLDAATGDGLPGVTVVVKNTTIGTGTDGTGNFSLSVPDNATLVLSYVGYITETISVGDKTTLSVKLKTDQKALDEVVVIGYGEVKKSDVTGSIVSVNPEDIKKTPSANVMESLQGRLPGVDITRSSGATGAGVNVTVRGNRSLTANNGPLFVVDGVQYTSIQDINPNDIQSMEVLKDAASTAIYGSRGANGVIIVTTKRGAAGKTRVSVNSYIGQTEAIYYPHVNDGTGYIAQKREANRTTGLWSSPADDAKIFTPADAATIAAGGTGYDWPSLFLKKGTQQEHQVGVSGGSEKTKFYTSFDFYNEQGILRMDNLNRYSLRFNIDQAINDKVKIGLQNQLTYFNQNARRDPLNIANKIDPLGAPYDENGNVVVFPNNGKDINPLSDEVAGNYQNNARTTRTFTTAYVDYQIVPGLSLRSNLGLTLSNSRTGIYLGSNTVDRAGSVPLSSYGTQYDTNWSWENILNYTKTFGDHSLTVTGITSLLTFNTETSRAQGANQLLASQLYYALGNASQQLGINSAYQNSKLISFAGRVQYNYKSRYLVTLTGREDGSSKLAAGNKWAFFPSAAVAWRIIEEDFMKDISVLSDLKLRTSYGIAGNYDIPPYSSQSVLTRIPFGYGETSAPGYAFSSRIGNNALGWELSGTANIGLDFAFLQNRLSGSVDVYQTNAGIKNWITGEEGGLLLNRFLPMTSGVGYITQNIGKTQNRGIELGLNARVIDKQDFKWNVQASWFKNQEKIVSLATEANDIANGWFIGSPTRVFYDYEKIGIWQTAEADLAKTFSQKPGQIKVKDQDGDGKITPADRKILGSALPKWNASFSNDFSYKGFDLSLQWFARYGQMLNYEYNQIFDPQGIENSSKQDYWTPENPTNSYPRPDASVSKSSMQYFSTLSYRDGSYLKLRAVTLGYNIPAAFLQKFSMSSVRVYVQGKNLATFSHIKDYDPERAAAAVAGPPSTGLTNASAAPSNTAALSNPIPRVLTAGININF